MLPYVITLGVLCILLLVALIVVSIQLGICKTRPNIPAVVIQGSIAETSGPMTQDQANKANSTLATSAQVQAAANLADFSGKTYWVQGTKSAMAVTIKDRTLSAGDASKPWTGLVTQLGF